MASVKCPGQSTPFFGTRRPSLSLGQTLLQNWSGPGRGSHVVPIAAGKIGPGKKWEHYELNKNGKPVRHHMHVKTGDLVQVIAGSDRGTVGRIVSVQPKTGTVKMEDVNTKVKHVKPKAEGQKGFVTKIDYPIHHSNVAHYSEGQQVTSRIGHRVLEDGTKVRYLKKTGEVIDSPRASRELAHAEQETGVGPLAPEDGDGNPQEL